MTAWETMGMFCSAWRDKNWIKMAELSQLTWRRGRNKKDLAAAIHQRYAHRNLVEFVLLGEQLVISSVVPERTVVDLNVLLKYVSYDPLTKALERTFQDRYIFTVSCERSEYEPSIDGTWGVNPISMRVFETGQYEVSADGSSTRL